VIGLPVVTGAVFVTEQSIELTIDVAGNMSLNPKPLCGDAEDLRRELKRMLSGNTDISMDLLADAMTPHQFVVSAMAVARQLNPSSLTSATNVKP